MGADVAVHVSDEFFETSHGRLRCVECHGGSEPATSRAEAHSGMDPVPSAGYRASICAGCHGAIVSRFTETLHATTRGLSDKTVALVLERADAETRQSLLPALDKQCGQCHVSGCGDCHVSRPRQAQGGFINGHVFNKTPSTKLNCIGCHGSRVEREFLGKGESEHELVPNVHGTQGEMECVNCHTGAWMHGRIPPYATRYDNPAPPRCTSCHELSREFLAIEYHSTHAHEGAEVRLQCQVCHAQDYNNCASCHVADDEDGAPYFVNEESYFDFKIGRNYLKSAEKPWDFIVVRQVPVSPETFEHYVEGALTGFDAQPTFKYATPHSITRATRQAATCEACHEDDSLFLTAGDLVGLPAEEQRANAPVIVDR